MASSYGGDVPTPKRNRRSEAKAERLLVGALGQALSTDEIDFEYVTSVLAPGGEKSQHVGRVARMLRKDILDKVEAAESGQQHLGALDPDCDKWVKLKTVDLKYLLGRLKPDLTEDSLAKIPRLVLMRRLMYALNTKERHDISSDFPT
jgi:hypothetical protein